MNCKECIKALDCFIDEELDKNVELVVKGHLEGCPECEAELEARTKQRQLLSNMPTPAISESFNQRLLQQTTRKHKLRNHHWLLSIAASTVVAVTLVFALIKEDSNNESPIVINKMEMDYFDEDFYPETVMLTLECQSLSEGGKCSVNKIDEMNQG